MKYKFKRFWVEWRDWVLIGTAMLLLFCLLMLPVWANHNAEKKTPMYITSEKDIEAKSFEYKGHKYLLFEKTNLVGPISVLHDPDCSHDN